MGPVQLPFLKLSISWSDRKEWNTKRNTRNVKKLLEKSTSPSTDVRLNDWQVTLSWQLIDLYVRYEEREYSTLVTHTLTYKYSINARKNIKIAKLYQSFSWSTWQVHLDWQTAIQLIGLFFCRNRLNWRKLRQSEVMIWHKVVNVV